VSAADSAHTIAAPGTCVISDKLNGGTSTYYGTSQAAPHVAATVALCIGSGGATGPCAGLAPAQVIARVRSDAAAAASLSNGFAGDPLRPITGRYYGYVARADAY
jgi:subtilisin family serine protease